ncbi:hypothetical protein [Mycoplasma sp. Z473B]|uniref:hypothetical protein n=1 Tax=Mycoplasma sp. Z473B TaxID=3401667 RepID=UPI003AB02504
MNKTNKKLFLLTSAGLAPLTVAPVIVSASLNEESVDSLKINKNDLISKIKTFDNKIDDIIITKLNFIDKKKRDLLLIQGSTKGIYIYDTISKSFFESIPNASLNIPDHSEIYYFGPMNYYYKENDMLVHLVDPNMKISLNNTHRWTIISSRWIFKRI